MTTDTPIATLSLNPAIDLSYLVSELVSFRKTKAKDARYDAGGNGINVSRALKRLHKSSHSCCILAGGSGAMLRHLLNEEGIEPEFITVDGETRINSTIQQRRPPAEFKISGVGPSNIPEETIDALTRRFVDLAEDGYGILTGSLPTGVPSHIYAKLCSQLNDQNAKVILDTKDTTLLSTLGSGLFLIKPNVYELELISGKSLSSIEAIAEEARKLQKSGVNNVCVSMGVEGAVFVNHEDSYYGPAPKIKTMCSVGAGDAMIAGLLAGLVDNLSAEETLLQGLVCGSGTASKPGTMLFDYDALLSLKEGVEIKSLGI